MWEFGNSVTSLSIIVCTLNCNPYAARAQGWRKLTSSAAGGGDSREHTVVRVSAEDYEQEGKDYTSVKVICLGDSAVDKSK